MEEYPKTIMEFETRFNTEEACRDYLFKLRWPKGFHCPCYMNDKAWPLNNLLYHCTTCDHKVSVIYFMALINLLFFGLELVGG